MPGPEVEVTVILPGLYREIVGTTRFPIRAGTLREALRRIREEKPVLEHHLFSTGAEFRPHVLCFLNDENTKYLESLDVPLREGDTIMFHQAISGG